MIRGTTPTYELTVSDFELAASDTVHVYLSQNNKLVLEVVTPTVVIDTINNKIRVPLTQEQTFKFKTGELTLQFRLKTISGVVYGSSDVTDEVTDIADNDEVI